MRAAVVWARWRSGVIMERVWQGCRWWAIVVVGRARGWRGVASHLLRRERAAVLAHQVRERDGRAAPVAALAMDEHLLAAARVIGDESDRRLERATGGASRLVARSIRRLK